MSVLILSRGGVLSEEEFCNKALNYGGMSGDRVREELSVNHCSRGPRLLLFNRSEHHVRLGRLAATHGNNDGLLLNQSGGATKTHRIYRILAIL
jgi:hypothetical protein